MRATLLAGLAGIFFALALRYYSHVSVAHAARPVEGLVTEMHFINVRNALEEMQHALLALNQRRITSTNHSKSSALACNPILPYIDSEAMIPIYLLVIGVEGTGHHALETVWKILSQFYDTAIITYDEHFHGIQAPVNVTRGFYCPTISREYSRFLIKEYLRMPRVRGKQMLIDARNSFPEGFGVGSLSHPDIRHLASFDGDLYDFRAIVLTRDDTAAVVSSIKRFFGEGGGDDNAQRYKNHMFQARVTQRLLGLINNNLEMLPCGKTLHLTYETLTSGNVAALAQPLANLLSVSVEHMNMSLAMIYQSRGVAMTPKINSREVDDINTFFAVQRVLWPVLSGPPPPVRHPNALLVPRNRRDPIVTPPLGGAITAANKSDVPPRFLMIDCQRHLGFNNILFVMEMGLYLARMLNRRLAFTGLLRIRRCDNVSLCARTKCRANGSEYECPLTLFLDVHRLQEAGIDLYQRESDLLDRLSAHHDLAAFDDIYADNALVVDRVPRDPEGTPLSTFPYYQIKFTCELVPTKIFQYTFNSSNPALPKNFTLVDFIAKYSKMEESVLYLHGTPHRVGLTPVLWSSEAALRDTRLLWQDLHAYHGNVDAHARQLVGLILGQSNRSAFLCVHLRRDDFTDLGWNKKALDLDAVIERIRKHRGDNEALYIATDEERLERLAPLRGEGAVFWADFVQVMRAQKNTADVAMLGFKDYVGLVEQKTCVAARTFLGSHCSSLTGTIVNMRREAKGEGVVVAVAEEA